VAQHKLSPMTMKDIVTTPLTVAETSIAEN
jgi:hypothetical protein